MAAWQDVTLSPSRSGQPAVDPEHTQVTMSKRPRGSQMGHLGAELDLGPIDKVDVRNEKLRLAAFGASETDFQNLVSYCNRMLFHYYIIVFCGDLTRPDPTAQSVTLGCHAPMVGVSQG